MTKDTLDLEEFMDRVQDDKELLFELLDIFISDFHIKRQQLAKAIEDNDPQAVEHIAHFLKGSCGNISAKDLRVIFFELEDRGRARNMDGIVPYLGEIDRKFEKLAVRIGELRVELQ